MREGKCSFSDWVLDLVLPWLCQRTKCYLWNWVICLIGKKVGVYEDYLGEHYLEEKGHGKWSKHVRRAVKQFQNGLQPEYIVLGGGNTKQLKELPKGCRRGANKNAFLGGYRMWDKNATMPKNIT